MVSQRKRASASDPYGTAAQGIFLKSTTSGTSGKIINYVDPTGETIFALLAAGLKLKGTLGAMDAR